MSDRAEFIFRELEEFINEIRNKFLFPLEEAKDILEKYLEIREENIKRVNSLEDSECKLVHIIGGKIE